MNYIIKIAGTSGIDTTKSGSMTDSVTYLQIKSDTVAEYARERNTAVLFRVELRFKINEDTKQFAKELFDWSKDTGEVYRKFEVEIKENKKLIRRIVIDKMFVEDYAETFSEVEQNTENKEKLSGAIATLKLIQKVGHIKDVSNN